MKNLVELNEKELRTIEGGWITELVLAGIGACATLGVWCAEYDKRHSK